MPDGNAPPFANQSDILISGEECRAMIRIARFDLLRLNAIVAHLDAEGPPASGTIYRGQRDELTATLEHLDGVNTDGVVVVLPKAAVDGLTAFGKRHFLHVKDVDAFMPAGAQAPEFERVLAAFTAGTPVPAIVATSDFVIEVSHA